MFYATSILSKKGPLGVIWIAAHLDRRLKRQQINETSITNSVDSIINPEAPLALRLSGQLMLGVVRIYSRKVGYLYQDTNETLIKIQQAFRDHANSKGTTTDALTVPTAAITLHDTLDDYELLLSAGPAPLDAQLGSLDPLAEGPLASQRDSLSMSIIEDLSGAFGSQAGMEDELFEVAGDELERRISMAMEVEQLRRDSSRRPSALFEGIVGRPSSPGAAISGPPSVVGGMLDADVSVGPTPGSGGVGKHAVDVGEMNVGDADALPDFGVDMLPDMGDMIGPATEHVHPATSAADAPAPEDDTTHTIATSTYRAQSAANNNNRKRKLVVDVANGRPAVDLDGRHMRALMVDRAPLLTKRGWGARDARPTHQHNGAQGGAVHGPHALLVGMVGGDDHGSGRMLQRPGVLNAAAAPLLLELFDGMVRLPGAGLRSPTRKQRASRTHDDILDNDDHDAPPSSKRRRSGPLPQPSPAPSTAHAAASAPTHPQDMSPVMYDDAPWVGAEENMSPWVEHAPEDAAAAAVPEGGPLGVTASKHTPAPQQGPLAGDDPWTGGASMGTGGSLLHTVQRSAAAGDAEQGFTARSRVVLGDLQQRAQGGPASLHAMAAGQGRLDAARLFFETLVLHSKGMVQLQQEVPYGDVAITVVTVS